MTFKWIKNAEELNDIDAYVSVYKAMFGFKEILLSRDEECGNMFTPWNTGYFQHSTRIEAIPMMISWAQSEEIPFYVENLTEQETAFIEGLMDKIK